MPKLITHDDFVNKLFEINPNLDVVSEYQGARKPIDVRCKIDGFIWSPLACNLTHKNHPTGCPICNSGKHVILKGVNDLWTTHPHIAKMLKDKNIGFEESHGSERRTDWICQRCNSEIKDRSICQVKAYGLACPFCSDGISYPEKFMISILNQLEIDYIPHKTFKWSNQKEYDFYIPNRNGKQCIIEVHGLQHYKTCSTWNDYDFQKNNDNFKEEISLSNGIELYFQIDCRQSDKDFIKNSFIQSGLLTSIEIDLIDWDKCDEYATLNSLLVEACNMYNEGLIIDEIATKLKKSTTTIRNYLHKGNKLKLCDCSEEEMKKHYKNGTKRKVYKKDIITHKIIDTYLSITDAAKSVGIKSTSISNCCRGIHKTAAGFLWEYV